MIQTIYRKSIILILAALAFSPACSKRQSFQATTTTEREILVTKNPSQPLHKKASLKLAAEFVLSGKRDGDDAFSTINSFAVDRDGTIFVCDERAALIEIFDGQGRFLNSIETARPDLGELTNPQIVGTTAQGELAVESAGHGRLMFYSRDGRLLRSTPLAGINTFRLGVNSKGEILIHLYRYVRPNILYALRLFDASLKELKTLGQNWEPQSVGNDLYAYLPILWWVIDRGDRIVYGNPKFYEIQIFGPDGTPARIIRKEQPPLPISEEEKAAYRKEYAKAPYILIHFPEIHSAFQKFTVDEKGWIYVMTWERAPGGEGYWYDIFDDQGIYTARIALNRMPQLWAGDRLYTLAKDASGKAVLTRYTYAWDLR
jgi:hypothetical protein